MKKTTRDSQKQQRGVALLLAMFLVLFAGLLMTPVLRRVVFHHDNVFREARFITALHIAEAGVEEALYHLSYDRDRLWTGWDTSDPDVYHKPVSNLYDSEGNVIGQYEVRIENPIPLGTSVNIGPAGSTLPFPITSTSMPQVSALAGVPQLDGIQNELRLIQIDAQARTVFSLGLFSDGDLELGGTTLVNSYDSTVGFYDSVLNAGPNGDSGSNGDILINGTPIIDGDAAAGGSIVIKGSKAEITGEVEGGMTQIDLPPVSNEVNAAKLENDNLGIPKAVKSNGQEVDAFNPATNELSIAANATLHLPGGTKENPKIYYFSDAQLSGGANLIVDDYVVIFTDGDIDFTGGTVINNGGEGPPEKMMIYSSGGLDTEIGLSGGAGYCGVVYAPDAHVKLTGGGHFYGAAVGGKVDVDGNAEFHYDEALGDVGLIAFFELGEWVERPRPDYSSLY